MATTTGAETSTVAPPPADLTIVADDADDDAASDKDSAIGFDAASSTASMTSSILRYRTIHGRTYHSETGKAKYW